MPSIGKSKQIERVWSVKNIRNAEKLNNIHVEHFLRNLEAKQIEQMKKAEHRNYLLTSDSTLEHLYVDILENGIYFRFVGCRSAYNVFCDFNGNIRRKPNNSKTIKTFWTRNSYSIEHYISKTQ